MEAAQRWEPDALPPARLPRGLVGGLLLAAGASALAAVLLLPPSSHLVAAPADSVRYPVFAAENAAYSLARDPHSVPLLHIPLDGGFGDYVDVGDPRVPDFPTSGALRWAEHMGSYFGWDVWIAGASRGGFQREHCILIERGPLHRSRCVPAAERSQRALLVSAPYSLVDTDERPVGMDVGERLGFWWHLDRSITVLLGDDPLR